MNHFIVSPRQSRSVLLGYLRHCAASARLRALHAASESWRADHVIAVRIGQALREAEESEAQIAVLEEFGEDGWVTTNNDPRTQDERNAQHRQEAATDRRPSGSIVTKATGSIA